MNSSFQITGIKILYYYNNVTSFLLIDHSVVDRMHCFNINVGSFNASFCTGGLNNSIITSFTLTAKCLTLTSYVVITKLLVVYCSTFIWWLRLGATSGNLFWTNSRWLDAIFVRSNSGPSRNDLRVSSLVMRNHELFFLSFTLVSCISFYLKNVEVFLRKI